MHRDLEFFEGLIIKFINRTITDEESLQLEKWVMLSKENKDFFLEMINANRFANEALHQANVKKNNLIPKKRNYALILAAASLAILLSLGLWLFKTKTELPDKKGFALIINGENLVINESEKEFNFRNQKIFSQNRGIWYFTPNAFQKISVQVPKGKILKVQLSDGTSVQLNAASQLSFPGNFAEQPHRNVALEGEGFFEVEKNVRQPFIVETKLFSTKVLGTKFNINSYEDDSEHTVTLLEGSIEVKDKTAAEKLLLKPGETADIRTNLPKKIKIEKARESQVAWLKDELSFDDETMPDIIKKIERANNVKFIYDHGVFGEERFSGNFKKENLDEILQVLVRKFECRYEVNGNIIKIKKIKNYD